MTAKAENYLNLSDEVRENLIELNSTILEQTREFNSVNLMLIDNIIDEYCNLIHEIKLEKSPEYVELGNIALDILKIGMSLKIEFESKVEKELFYA